MCVRAPPRVGPHACAICLALGRFCIDVDVFRSFVPAGASCCMSSCVFCDEGTVVGGLWRRNG